MSRDRVQFTYYSIYDRVNRAREKEKVDNKEYCECGIKGVLHCARVVPRRDDVIMSEWVEKNIYIGIHLRLFFIIRIETPGHVSIFSGKRGKEEKTRRAAHCRAANLNYLLPPLNQQMNVEYAARPILLYVFYYII